MSKYRMVNPDKFINKTVKTLIESTIDNKIELNLTLYKLKDPTTTLEKSPWHYRAQFSTIYNGCTLYANSIADINFLDAGADGSEKMLKIISKFNKCSINDPAELAFFLEGQISNRIVFNQNDEFNFYEPYDVLSDLLWIAESSKSVPEAVNRANAIALECSRRTPIYI